MNEYRIEWWHEDRLAWIDIGYYDSMVNAVAVYAELVLLNPENKYRLIQVVKEG